MRGRARGHGLILNQPSHLEKIQFRLWRRYHLIVDELFVPLPTRGKSSALEDRIRQAIESERLAPGTKLPPSRSFAQALGVSRNVVISAYARLEAQGLVQARQGSETRVKEIPARVKASSQRKERSSPRFDFRFASVSQDERTQEHWISRIRHHAQRSLRRYSDPQGLGELREEVALFLARYRGIKVHPDQILLVSGSQQAIDLVGRSLVQPGDDVWVESPAYQGASAAMQLSHLKVQEAPLDEMGISIQALKAGKAGKLLFCTPSHQIPTGRLMSQERRFDLLKWARRMRVLILEDDYDGLPYYGSASEVPSLYSMSASGQVLHVGTFSLLLFPGIRIGYVCGSPEQIQTLTRARWLAGRHNPELQQAALCDLMKSGEFYQHLSRRRRELVKKRAALLEKIQALFSSRAQVLGEHAGTFITLQLKLRAPRARMRALAEDPELGVSEVPGAAGAAARPKCLHLELCYSGMTIPQLEEGITRIFQHVDKTR